MSMIRSSGAIMIFRILLTLETAACLGNSTLPNAVLKWHLFVDQDAINLHSKRNALGLGQA